MAMASTPQKSSSRQTPVEISPAETAAWIPIVTGLVVSAVFYAVITPIHWGPTDRYFLGHPVAIAATILFCVAAAILGFKAANVAGQNSQFDALRDQDLLLSSTPSKSNGPTETWKIQNDAGLLARNWQAALAALPAASRNSLLVRRLNELLTRQSRRNTTKHISDDLREVSMREADAAHDSVGLVRIIVWAIPMLGFLGTVIGITQTLGGLDFTDGTAAVDRLKSGLYVAFDTTAIGLVLSVLAIFLQFPVERAEQSLLARIDARVADLLAMGLPADDPADNQAALITQLCEGIQVSVAQSLATQAGLWRETIDEAHAAWTQQHSDNASSIRDAIGASLLPALAEHASKMSQSVDRIDQIGRAVGKAMADQTVAWQSSIADTTAEVQTHRRTLLTHTEAMTSLASRQAIGRELAEKQLADSLAAIDNAAMADAMRTLARAVDFLSRQLPTPVTAADTSKRRAA